MTHRAGRRSIRSLMLAGALALAAPIGALADNLADALVGAYQSSGLLEQNRALLRAADEDVAAAVATLRPIVDFTIGVQRTYDSIYNGLPPRFSNNTSPATAQLQANWLLWNNGGRRFSIAAAKETVLATRQQLLSIEQNVLLRATAAYMDVLLQTENVSIQNNNQRVLGEELRAAENRFDVGEVTRTDVALAQSRVAAAQSNVTAARGLLGNAEAEYLAVVGRPAIALAGLPRLPAVPATPEEAQAVALRRHPDILAAQHQVAAAELTVQREQKDLGPSLSANASVGLTNQLDSSQYRDTAQIGLQLNQRLYQGGGIAAQVRRAMALRDATRGNLLTVQRAVVQGVSDAYARLQVARSNLNATAERVRAAQVAFDGIREEATLGARTTLDVLTAEQELLNARISQISARNEQAVATYQVLAAQGLLTAEQLGLGVQIYDPTIYYNVVKDAPAALSRQSKQLDRVMRALGKQ